MYVEPNFTSRAALKKAVKEGEKVTVFSPGPFPCVQEGTVAVEGPHYPKPHTWYAQVEVLDGEGRGGAGHFRLRGAGEQGPGADLQQPILLGRSRGRPGAPCGPRTPRRGH